MAGHRLDTAVGVDQTRLFNSKLVSFFSGTSSVNSWHPGSFFTSPNFATGKLNLITTVFATALIIATRPAWLNRGRLVYALAQVGTVSYSLYLVHWPVVAFLNNANISGENFWWPYRLMVVLGSIAIACALYYFVEARFRTTDKPHSASIKPLVLLSILFLLISVGLSYLSSGAGYQALFRDNNGLSQECSSTNFESINECKTSEVPTPYSGAIRTQCT